MTKLAWEDFQEKGRKKYRLAPLAALFVFYTGVRVGELTAFRYSDIEGGTINVQRMARKDDHVIIPHPKTESGFRDIPVISKAMEIIEATRKFREEHQIPYSEESYIFSEYDNPLPTAVVEKYFRKYCKEIGTYPKGPHKARKTYASSLIDSDVNINTVREVLGHSDERTTYRCYVFDRNTPAEKKQKFEDALSH